MAANAYDRRILQVGIVLLFINGVTSCAFKLATTPHFSENIVQFFILQIFVFIFSTAAFYRFGIPLVKWIFTGRTVWTTIVKTALALIIASGAGLVTFLIGFTTAQRAASSPQLDSMVQIYFVLGTAFGFPYGVLFIVSCFLIVAMTAFLTNGVFSTVLVFYLYFVAFMWVAWVLVSTIAFVLTRSFERKGLAVFLAAISTFLSALMQYKGH